MTNAPQNPDDFLARAAAAERAAELYRKEENYQEAVRLDNLAYGLLMEALRAEGTERMRR